MCLTELQEGHHWLNYPLKGNSAITEGQCSGCVPEGMPCPAALTPGMELQTHHCCSAIVLRYCQEVTLQWEIPNSLIFALFRRININKRSSARSQLRAGLPACVGLPSVEGGDVQELLCFSIDPSIPHSPWSQQ